MPEFAKAGANSAVHPNWQSLRRGCFYFLLAACAVWVLLDTLYVKFPYIQPGSKVVGDVKRSWSLSHSVFDSDATVRIMAFGNSKTLASFNSKLLDADLEADGVQGKVQSMNEAIPGESRYVTYLEQLIATGARPTHVLIQIPPVAEDHDLTLSEWLHHDKLIVNTVFPFREMPRDFTLFVFASIGHGGISGFYRECAGIGDQVIRDRGYYFIKGQSHYAGDRLPDDFSLPTDTPDKQGTRPIDTAVPAFVRLAALAKKYGFKVVVFPAVYRVGEFLQASSRYPEEEPVPSWPEVEVLGDDYWLMHPRYFSDPVHPNIEGAKIYTEKLAALLAPILKKSER